MPGFLTGERWPTGREPQARFYQHPSALSQEPFRMANSWTLPQTLEPDLTSTGDLHAEFEEYNSRTDGDAETWGLICPRVTLNLL